MKAVELSGVRVDAGGRTILGPFDLALEPRSWTAIVGRSGSGKTTLLRVVAGLSPLTEGRVNLFGVPATDGRRVLVPPEKRGIGFVFQGGGAGLWPHMSVRKTLEFVLSVSGVPRAERARRAGELIELVQLAPQSDQKPGQLSGGEAQRLALARAVAMQPRLLLLDEPLGPLDVELRSALLDRLVELRLRFDLTLLHVTHDPAEIAHVVDRTTRIEAGRLFQGALQGPTEPRR